MSDALVGKKVRVEFNPHTWPIHTATYTYEGRDEEGYFLRRVDGIQRHMLFEDVVGITEVETDIPEGEF